LCEILHILITEKLTENKFIKY